MKRRIFVALVLYFTFTSLAFGLDEIIEKKVFKMDALTLVSGKQIPRVEIGYETYGKLSPAKDNAILICHYFSGNSNAAGKYSKDARPGYWDKIIGPGLSFDTNRFFIISSDILGNHRPKNPHVTTTGPASIDSKTGKPYGNTFPLFTIRDIVAVQHALVKSMGINKLKAVAGPSLGGFQTFQWAVSYPDMVESAIVVISHPRAHGWMIALVKNWAQPIYLDVYFKGGDYYGGREPTLGLVASMMRVTMDAFWYPWTDTYFGRKWADEKKSPFESLDNEYLAAAAITQIAQQAAEESDANAFIYLTRAAQNFDIADAFEGDIDKALASIKARLLLVGSQTDLIFQAPVLKEYGEKLKTLGKDVNYFEIQSKFGHFGGLNDIEQASDAIRKILGSDAGKTETPTIKRGFSK